MLVKVFGVVGFQSEKTVTMGLFLRKKALKVEHAHETQPCVLFKYTPITTKNHPRPLDETPGGAEEEKGGREMSPS